MNDTPRTDAEVAAAELERTAAQGGNVITAPQRGPKDGKRAPERAVYEDQNGRRRVVGAGDLIPPGWLGPVDSTPIGERGARTPMAHPEGAIGNADRGGRDGVREKTDDDGETKDKRESGPRESGGRGRRS